MVVSNDTWKNKQRLFFRRNHRQHNHGHCKRSRLIKLQQLNLSFHHTLHSNPQFSRIQTFIQNSKCLCLNKCT